jgi:hypothetical protein
LQWVERPMLAVRGYAKWPAVATAGGLAGTFRADLSAAILLDELGNPPPTDIDDTWTGINSTGNGCARIRRV